MNYESHGRQCLCVRVSGWSNKKRVFIINPATTTTCRPSRALLQKVALLPEITSIRKNYGSGVDDDDESAVISILWSSGSYHM